MSKKKSDSKAADKPGISRTAYTAGAVALGLGAVAAGALAHVLHKRREGDSGEDSAEHVPTDLMGDKHPGPHDRAPEAFRPDPEAPVPPGEREGLRPAPLEPARRDE